MVRLGFVKDAEQCPPDFARVFVRPAVSRGAQVESTIYSQPNESGEQLFELALDVPRGVERLNRWAPAMADVLDKMGWRQWWLDSFSISMAADRYVTEALNKWGAHFWSHYRQDAVVLVQVGLQRDAIAHSVDQWLKRNDHLRLDPEYDFDEKERERDLQNRERTRKFKSLLWPKFLGARRRA